METNEKETWKDIDGYEGKYKVSSRGGIKSYKRSDEGKILKQLVNDSGHRMVRLYEKGEYEHAYVHRLVAEAFIPNPNNYPLVLHNEDDPSKNAVGDIRWGTHKENTMDKFRNGCTWKRPRKIYHIETGIIFDTQSQVAEAFRMTRSAVGYHVRGELENQKFAYVGN